MEFSCGGGLERSVVNKEKRVAKELIFVGCQQNISKLREV